MHVLTGTKKARNSSIQWFIQCCTNQQSRCVRGDGITVRDKTRKGYNINIIKSAKCLKVLEEFLKNLKILRHLQSLPS